MIIWGDRDHIIPVHQGHATHDAIPGSRLEIFEGAGHFPHCEQPDRFAAGLIDFMDTTEASTTSPAQWRERMVAHST